MTVSTRRFLNLGQRVAATILGLASLWSVMVGTRAWAQQQEVDNAVFGEVVEVHVVNVDVYATDKKGNPVTDLTASDFEISEDGKPVEITHFALVSGETETTDIEPRLDTVDLPSALGFVDSGSASRSERLWLVIYFDNTNLRTFDRKRFLDQLRELLAGGFAANIDIMVASYDRALNIRLPFTVDPARIADALTDLEASRCEGNRYDSERLDFLERLDVVSNQIEAVDMLRPHAGQVLHDLTLTVGALEEMIERVAGLPGRKAILHISSGLPRLAAFDLFMAIENRFPTGYALYKKQPYDATNLFVDLTRMANGHDVTLYTLDAGGVPASGSGGVEKKNPRDVAAADFVEMDQSSNLQLPLRQLADETGGLAILHRNDVRPALRRVAGDFQTYYSIGYTPAHNGDGQYHAIAVQVNRRGVRLRHPSGYLDKTSTARMSEGVRATLLYAVDDNPLGMVVEIGEEGEAERDRFLVPIQVIIPLNRLVLLPDDAVRRGLVRLFLAAMDDEGRMTEVLEIPSEIELATSDSGGSPDFWRFSTHLRMRGGHHTIALGVRDEVADVSAFTTHDLSVGGAVRGEP